VNGSVNVVENLASVMALRQCYANEKICSSLYGLKGRKEKSGILHTVIFLLFSYTYVMTFYFPFQIIMFL
jgi:hypothetical protein